MQNLEKLEKSKGVIVFAFNTDVDYVKIADRTARLIAKNLKLPITLVTGLDTTPKFNYDQVIRVDNGTGNFRTNLQGAEVEWKNFGRYTAYELSPYDETLLLDIDYAMFDNSLLKLFDTAFDYKLQYNSYSEAGMIPNLMGETSLPFVWATVVLFRKSEKSKMFFDLVGRIQRNYTYYKLLYNIRERNYRNDYAFAIANIILNGYSVSSESSIPWPMYTAEQKISNITLQDNMLHIRYADIATVTPLQNIHIMDKAYLQSDEFNTLVGDLCD